MTLPKAAEKLLNTFQAANSWEERMRLLMQVGNTLEPVKEHEKITKNLLPSCESAVWIVSESHNQQWHIRAYSEGRLIRGLLAVLLARVNNLSSQAIQSINIEQWFEQLGLANQLSSSRRDGLYTLFKIIQSL